MQKPTLLGVQGQARDVLSKYGAGLCFEPENEKDFILKLSMLRNKNLYKKCQDGCSDLAINYDRKKLANKMLDIIIKIIKAR